MQTKPSHLERPAVRRATTGARIQGSHNQSAAHQSTHPHRAQSNARMLAERLSHHPNVTLTRYPGLASHPTHEAARRQLKDFGTVISFDVRGDAADAEAVCAGLRLVQHATSLGAVESTIERRAGIPGQEHLPATLLRLSVGIEAVQDLWADLDRALSNVTDA